MTITVAVTGGIGAGKSTIAQRLGADGAVVIDSDRLAREVVGLGTPGLAAVADRFGSVVVAADGSLDRAALAAIVFADAGARRELEAITHPLVRARFAALRDSAPPRSVVVNDIPLLTSSEMAATFHLVIGVGAPGEVRVQRLMDRGLTAKDARARIGAQISDDRRRVLCDTWIDNSAGPVDVLADADRLWARLAEFAGNVEARRPARRGGAALVAYDPDWPAAAHRLSARVRRAVGDCRVDHVGSTAVEGLSAQNVIDLQLAVADLGEADRFAPALAQAGFPRCSEVDAGMPRPGDAKPAGDEPAHLRERLHVNADPGQSINLYLRVRNAPEWRRSLRVRDWLRADGVGRAEYTAKGFLPAAADELSRAWAVSTDWLPG